MCRIAGIIDKNQNPEQLLKDVTAMCDSMKHGGPDGEGFYSESALGLQFGHRRLALIDLSPSGKQPMSYHDKNLTITFNGEIYNYLELKEELSANGLIFTTQSDTEVILAAYRFWGEECFTKFIGMFAFAIFDQAKQVTFLVRDQMGIKPLYYTTNNNRLVFGSEIKSFKATSYQYQENRDWKIYFLAFGHIPHPFTTLQDVYSLQPGHFLKWDHQENKFAIFSFKEELKPKTVFDQQEASDLIAAKLKQAVEQHLITDASIGVFLSGGIDSSIITLLANESIGKNLKSLSINFQEKTYSEDRFQKIIADQINGIHHNYLVKESDLTANFDQIIDAMDQPTNDGINLWFVTQYAKADGLKAVLSGIGADELLGGYPSFKRIKLIKKLKHTPRFLLKLSAYIPHDKLKRISYLSYKNPVGEYLFLRGFFTPDAISKILSIDKKHVDHLLENFPIGKLIDTLEGEERVAWMETNLFMQNQLLKDTDFMSMSHGVEVRVPYLDQNFVAATQSIANQKRFPTRPKGLLIDAFKNIIPESIWNRAKMGFTFPLQQWLLKNEKIINEKHYEGYALQLIKKFKAGKLHWSKAFALYQIANSNNN
ncbi:MAG: asparagine synthase (glutamine-hydrolyzing) [Pedobacter sp.]|nr:MAG: asparagine synthase (glutamine-hydrolyzing) [Pedobacter sp.]